MHHRHLSVAFCALAAPLCCQWQRITPPSSPGNLRAPAMAADPSGNVLLFGGDTGNFQTPFSSATWSFSGFGWTQPQAIGPPTGRSEARLVYDGNRGVYVLYGGWQSPFSVGSGIDETWEFAFGVWTQRAPTNTPGGLWKHAMCFDALRNVTVLFGGAPSGLPGASNQTWEYAGVTWTLIPTSGNPGPRENHAMCYHTGISRTVLFGGVNPLGGISSQTWLYSGTTWVQLPVTGAVPSARAGAELVYDPVRDVSILTGGVDNFGNALDDTWEFDGSGWSPVPSSGAAGGNFGLAFDTVRRRAVRYGGTGLAAGQTWLFGAVARGLGTGCPGSNGVPALTAAGAPRIGQNYTLNLGNLAPAVPLAAVVLSLNEIPPTALGGVGLTGCTAYIDPQFVASFAASGGSATWTGAIPNNATLLGVGLFAQGLSIDGAANPAGLTVSNAIAGLVGF